MTHEVPEEQSAAWAFFYINERSFSTCRIYYTMSLPALTHGYPWSQPHAGPCWWSHEHLNMIKFVSLYLHTNTYACLGSILAFV